MTDSSSLFKAGRIFLLIGAIMSAFGALFLLAASIFLLTVGNNILGGESGSAFPATVVGWLYLGLGALLVVGCVFGFRAYGAAKAGDARRAWINGLVAALLPPLQIVPLVGAILCLVSPESQESKA